MTPAVVSSSESEFSDADSDSNSVNHDRKVGDNRSNKTQAEKEKDLNSNEMQVDEKTKSLPKKRKGDNSNRSSGEVSAKKSSGKRVKAEKASKVLVKKEKKVKVKREVKVKDNGNDLQEVSIKELTHVKKLERAMKAHKWWEDKPLGGDEKWSTLEHSGVMFPPSYERLPDNIKLKYDGEEVYLTKDQEELAYLYARVPVDGPQLKDPKISKMFNANFFKDFKALLGKKHKIKKFSLLDFSAIRAFVEAQKELKKSLTKEEKQEIKLLKEAEKLKYTFAFVNGNLQKVGNMMVEPPDLFRGRGFHPKTGTYKKRVMPEQITINIGEDDPVPPCPMPGHSWGTLVHKHDTTWLAGWKENVLGNQKYVWLAASSGFKGKSDREKYEKARRLKNIISKIRKDYESKLDDTDQKERQLGTAMWVIDRLALRVGGEKDDDEADTVGCCSLRVEHVSFDKEACTLTLDFLGKDSMRHFQTYNLRDQYGDIGELILKNFTHFCASKKKDAEVFDVLSVQKLNDHLKSLMPGLSAKVFRTFNASTTLEQQLPENIGDEVTVQEKMIMYNAANRQVAILCNHQKTVSKSIETTLGKMSDGIDLLVKQKKELQQMLKHRKAGKEVKLKPEGVEDKEEKKKISHLFGKQPTVNQVEKRITSWEGKISKQKLTLKNKDDNKTVALGTSKINYCDPRISVAWAKQNEVPIEKIFPQALRDKFPWAMSESTNFRF